MGRRFDIPGDVLKCAYWGAGESKEVMSQAVSGVRDLCAQAGLVNPVSRRLWKVLGIWQESGGSRHPEAQDQRQLDGG
jgi:hypothetical protein